MIAPRVLITAEHASLQFGGEAALPFHYFRLLRERGVEAWLLAHARTRPELFELLPRERERMAFVEDSSVHRALHRAGRSLPASVSHSTTGLALRASTGVARRGLAKTLVERHGIQVVHEPIPVSPKEPSWMFGLGVPVVLGPLNGGMHYPPAFRRRQAFLERGFVLGARFASQAIHALVPGKLVAQTVLVANERTRAALPRGLQGRVELLVENGVDLSDAPVRPSDSRGSRGLRVLFAGRLVGWKGVDLLLGALAKTTVAEVERLDVAGDGPLRGELESLTARLGLGGRVRFLGWLPQANLRKEMSAYDALVLPSLFECGGAVVLEAMAASLPVIATAWGGPADYLDAGCGILVEPAGDGGFEEGLAAALRLLASSESLCRSLGAEARRRAEARFSWSAKIDSILGVYLEAIARHGTQPLATRQRPAALEERHR